MQKTLLHCFLLFVLLLLVSSKLEAQQVLDSKKEPWSFGLNGYYGAFFKYRGGLDVLNFTHPMGAEVFAQRHSLGKRYWERKYKLPAIGFALTYHSYGMPQELGRSLSLTSYLDGPVTPIGKGNLRYDFGTGLVWNSRYYNTYTNELNKAFGSPFAFALRGSLYYERPLSPEMYLSLRFTFRHFSNGSLNQSNNGMNMPLLGLGLRYQARQTKPLPTADSAQESHYYLKRIRLNLRLAAGVKEVLRDDSKHPVYTLSLYASKRLSQTNSLLLSADVLHDSAVPEEYINQALPVPEGPLDLRTFGLSLGHELHLSQLSLVVLVGRYLHQPHGLFPDFYQRYGLKYQLSSRLSASAMLMAHKGTANVIEWGLGVHL